ncbi:annexin B11 isoform X2 [Drosophila bipectinata]|uniref:annexin B11 isoform X2 n=1 Tax=Drosophila bipectinata TaxID=42026 RepID=UPI001C89E7FE|nr:annexin B11 isoform X1 [Drosophila bipectinata]XP_043067174.1 annexin B11 isoform X1 [Drosophila bipectinata]
MYPFGSRIPDPLQPPTSSSETPRAPFGAGWVQPMNQNPPYPLPTQLQFQPQRPTQAHPYIAHQNVRASYPAPISAPYPSISSSSNPNPYPSPSHSSQFASQHQYQQNVQPSSGNTFYKDQEAISAENMYGPGQNQRQGYGGGGGNGQGHWHGKGYGHGQPHEYRPPTALKEGAPTVKPVQGFDPVKDAHDLRKAMKGFGTDEEVLINIICRRSNEQRQEIQRQYKTHFGKDLIEDIKSETSGNFEKLLVGLLRPIVDFYCAELNNAMAGIGTDEEVLIEILCTLSNMEIYTIKNQYLRLYGAHLESELKSETSGNFKRLLISLCTAARDESGRVDPNLAKDDARELLKAGELRVGTDESMFNMILCQRNYQQLKLIFQEYENMTGHSLEKAIKKEFSGDIMEGLVAIFRCVTNKAEYFASRLHKSMAGIGTNDTQLIRVIITRSEIDMVDIKVAFERLYGKSLKSWIKGDTSGHYKHALYALVGEQRSS